MNVVTAWFGGVALLQIACGNGGGQSDASAEAIVRYETCSPCPQPPRCLSGEVMTCCTCVKLPQGEAGRTSCTDMNDYCGDGAPDISCLKPGGYPATAEPKMVSLHGVVDVYATGPDSTGVTIEVYEEGPDATLGSLVARATSEDTCPLHEAELPPPHEVGDELTYCPGLCVERNADTTDCRRLAYYETDATVPTNKPLIVKTSGSAGTWKEMYSYNVWFFDNEVRSGKVFYKARILSTDDWRLIPVSAGDASGIAPGKSAVAGEIHDCGDVRLFFATVGTNPLSGMLTYFNGKEEKLYPDRGRVDYGTNLDGLYAAIEIDADRLVWVTALATISGEGLVNLGWRRARTFPDALTSVTLKGTRPDQVPAQ